MINRKLSPSIQLSFTFLLFGLIWIMLTDTLSASLAGKNLSFFSSLQTYKGFLFMVIAAVFVFFQSKRMFQQQQSLQHQLAEERIQYKDELAREVFSAQELERRKLGEELHDNINQLLGVIKLYIEHAHMNPSATDDMLIRSAECLTQVITEVRTLSRSLISPELQDLGLIESINELIENVGEIGKITIVLKDVDFSEDSLPEMKKLAVYRIMQEQLNNVVKHAQARHVDIELKRAGAQVQLTIHDNGIGFDMEKTRLGLGLKNIRHRLELINGNMRVESSPGCGCRLEAMFDA